MKKTICIIALMTFVFASVCFGYSPVFAAGEATFTVTCIINKVGGVGQTKEVELYYGVKDFVNLEQFENEGVNVFRGTLEFDEEVFEPIEINLDNNGNFAGIKSTTKEGEVAMIGQTNWAGLTYNPENHQLIVENGSYVSAEELVLKITLRVKATAKTGNTTVTLKDVEAGNPEADIYPTNKTVSQDIEIVQSVSEATDPEHEDGFGGYIRILPDTTVEELKALQPIFTSIKDASGKTLNSTDYVPTGATTADSNFAYTIITVGDLNSDGKMSATDLSQIKSYYVGSLKTLNDNQKRAADIKWDAKLSATDISQARQLIVKLGDPKIAIWYGEGEATCAPVSAE